VYISALVPAGTWFLYVSTDGFTGTECGSDYTATVSCSAVESPIGLIGEPGFSKDRYVSFDATTNGTTNSLLKNSLAIVL
jgi:hypothetical protein